MPRAFPKILGSIFLYLNIFLITQPVYSQGAIERATRETDILGRRQDIQEKLKSVPDKPPEPKIKEVPTGEPGEKFFVKKINLVGCEFVPCADFSGLLDKYQNKEVTLNDLEGLAKDIEREYLKRNIIAAVIIPAQDIKDQVVTLQIVEAKMGKLIIQEHKYYSNNRLNYYWKVPSGAILRYDKISQSVQMMNKNPDREVKAALAAGKKLGTTDVILSAQTNFPVHATFSFDREGIPSTGKKRVGYGVRHNNFLGLDDTFIAGSTIGRSFGGTYFYHTLPIKYSGASVLYGYSRSWSKPLGDYANTGLKSDQVNSNISLHQDLYKQDDYLGEVYAGFDAQDKVTKNDSGLINRDRQRIFSLGTSLVKRDVGKTTTFSSEFAQGVTAFGATGYNNPLASRGAYPVFQKFTMNLQHRRALPYNSQTNLRFKSQLASRKLTPQQEFGLGGIDSVRGYAASDYLADNALFSSAELLIPAFFIPQDWKIPYAEDTLKNQTTPVAFVDYGWGKRRGSLSTEKGKVNLLGIGAGLRLSLFNQALVRMEWGFPVAANNPISESMRGRFHFSVDFQEKLPEEIARIRKLIEEEHVKQWAKRLIDEEVSRPDSPIRKKMDGYRQLVKNAQQKGNHEEVKIINQKISALNASLYRQAEEYVQNCVLQEKELQERRKLAEMNYKEGKIDEAKKLWQDIIDQGEKKHPLILEYK